MDNPTDQKTIAVGMQHCLRPESHSNGYDEQEWQASSPKAHTIHYQSRRYELDSELFDKMQMQMLVLVLVLVLT